MTDIPNRDRLVQFELAVSDVLDLAADKWDDVEDVTNAWNEARQGGPITELSGPAEYLRGQLDLIADMLPGEIDDDRHHVAFRLLVEKIVEKNFLAISREVTDELTRNRENSDVHTKRDMAADVVERLIKHYRLDGYNRDDSNKDL